MKIKNGEYGNKKGEKEAGKQKIAIIYSRKSDDISYDNVSGLNE